MFLCVAFIISFFNIFWTSIPKPVPKETVTILGSALHCRDDRSDYKNEAYRYQYGKTIFIYDTDTQKSVDIFAEGYYDLFSPYVINDGEFVCSATRTYDDKPFLLFFKQNKLSEALQIDHHPDQLVFANGNVYYVSGNFLCKTNTTNALTTVLRDDVTSVREMADYSVIFTDGSRILYSSDNTEHRNWFMYDCSTDAETLIAEATTCAGFTNDGYILFGYKKRPYYPEKMFYKKTNPDTLKSTPFMPWIRFLSPTTFDDIYIKNTHYTAYGSILSEPHLVSLKTSCAYYLPDLAVSAVDGIGFTICEILHYL